MHLLLDARWLATSQIARTFFQDKTLNAVNKRMSKLVQAGLLRSLRPGWMAEQYYSLTQRGCRHIDPTDSSGGAGTSRFPKQLQHFSWINDLRIWFQAQSLPRIRYDSYWQSQPGRASRGVVPDALVALEVSGQKHRLAVEVDCGTENASVVAQKLDRYSRERHTFDAPLKAVFVWAPGARRIYGIARACYRAGVGASNPECWLADIERLTATRLDSPDVISLATLDDDTQPPAHRLDVLLGSPVSLSCREDTRVRLSDSSRGSSSSEDAAVADAVAGRRGL